MIDFLDFVEKTTLTTEWDPGQNGNETVTIYVSKIDGSFLDMPPGMDTLKMLHKNGIIEHIQNYRNNSSGGANIGFNPEEQKWYGWSHRAIYGFTIGSTCKTGDCHYHAPNKEDYMESSLKFWSDKDHLDMKAEEGLSEDGKTIGIKISWTYSDTIGNKELHGTRGGTFSHYPESFGRGEWTAMTMEDAKIMAGDFARGVS